MNWTDNEKWRMSPAGGSASTVSDEADMTTSLDLDTYFQRIQWDGGTSPTFATLAGLLRAHISHIPFENLDVLLGRPVRLDLDSLQGKLVRARRGGYCFEHATLFAAVLEKLGFQPVRHAARVILFVPRGEAPRTHMFLTVSLQGTRFVVDPGFGPFAAPAPLPLGDAPLPLGDGVETRTDNDTHWMDRDGDLWVLRVRTGDKRFDGWVTTLEHENPIDFEVANHFVSTHPASLFVNTIMMSALTPDGRVNLRNRDLNILRGPEPQAMQLADRAALRALLLEHFGFDLPDVEHLRVPAIPEWQ